MPAAAPAPAKPTKCSLPMLLENRDAPTYNKLINIVENSDATTYNILVVNIKLIIEENRDAPTYSIIDIFHSFFYKNQYHEII